MPVTQGLVALGYNGVVWHLRDTNGDGLEDKAEVFWDSKGTLRSPIGLDLTPPGYEHGDGVFVVAKTRCVRIVDSDKDGKADKEIVIAEGWKESFHQVDGLGVVLRDITDPSFAINPDHLTHVVQLVDGRTLTGVVRTVGDKVRIGNL